MASKCDATTSLGASLGRLRTSRRSHISRGHTIFYLCRLDGPMRNAKRRKKNADKNAEKLEEREKTSLTRRDAMRSKDPQGRAWAVADEEKTGKKKKEGSRSDPIEKRGVRQFRSERGAVA